MRRRIDYNYQPGLRGGEMRRMVTLVVMLALVGMLMTRAKDPHMWAMFGDASAEPQSFVGADEVPPPEIDKPESPGNATAKPLPATVTPPATGSPSQSSTATGEPLPSESAAPITNPEAAATPETTSPAIDAAPTALDEDPEEQEALQEELQVINDKSGYEFDKVEMSAYWRLVRWTLSQSFASMQAKAIKHPKFGDIYLHPDEFRGELVELRLHLRQVLEYPVGEIEKDNPAGLSKIYEVRGYTEDSKPMWYWCVCPELPKGMPLGENITVDGNFVGYFLKLTTYIDREGTNRATPVLVGRFEWTQPPFKFRDPEEQAHQWLWTMLVGTAIGVIFFIRWGLRQMSGRSRPPVKLPRMPRHDDDEGEKLDLDTFLDRAEVGELDKAINEDEQHDSDREKDDDDED